jgi:hypothetical protein
LNRLVSFVLPPADLDGMMPERIAELDAANCCIARAYAPL